MDYMIPLILGAILGFAACIFLAWVKYGKGRDRVETKGGGGPGPEDDGPPPGP